MISSSIKKGIVCCVVSLAGCVFSQEKKPVDCNCDVIRLSDKKYDPAQYIRSDCFDSLLIEIDAFEGVEPIDEKELIFLESILKHTLDKPKGITHVYSDTNILQAKDVYTIDDLKDIAHKYRSFPAHGKKLSMYVLYMNGCYNEDKVAGVALDGGMFFVFRNAVESFLDKAVFMHEFGHELGLVNNETKQQSKHEDPKHNGHDVNKACVMFYRLTDALNYLYDKQCLDDIAAVKK